MIVVKRSIASARNADTRLRRPAWVSAPVPPGVFFFAQMKKMERANA